MKQLLTVMAMIFFASLTQSFTPVNKSNNTSAGSPSSRFNYARFMHSLWLNPVQGMRKSKAPMVSDSYASVENYWQANVIINFVSFVDPYTPAQGYWPLYPGDTGYASDNEFNFSVYVDITIPGPPEDPEASRKLYYQPGVGFPSVWHCQPITGSGVYAFHGVSNTPGARIIVDTGTCP
jgi:hypothetical protein